MRLDQIVKNGIERGCKRRRVAHMGLRLRIFHCRIVVFLAAPLGVVGDVATIAAHMQIRRHEAGGMEKEFLGRFRQVREQRLSS